MARFSEEMALHVSRSRIMEICERAVEGVDLILEEHEKEYMHLKEAYRFDHFNPVEIDIRIEQKNGTAILKVEGSCSGEGALQESHVRAKVRELLSRVQIDMEYGLHPIDRTISSSLANELEMLSRLHDQGVLTDYEFRRAKEKLLRNES